MSTKDFLEKDYYKALGVSKTAKPAEIKAAYRKLARKYHPDANKGDASAEERFKEISEAYSVLSDEKRRKEYDEARSLFWWFMQATALTVPELHVLYRLDGGIGTAEREIDLSGYRGSRPVRVGNGLEPCYNSANSAKLRRFTAVRELRQFWMSLHHPA